MFSRAGCAAAVKQCLDARISLTTPEEQAEIGAVVDATCSHLPENDLEVLGFHEFRDGLVRGIAAHHAGMLPTFKEVVEVLFSQGFVKIIFATETLALGINMPARSVVIEKLSKWNGETHANITPGEYTQLTGRAGRRGIDIEGHGVVLWQPGLDPKQVAGLASTRTYPLNSSFQPSLQHGRQPRGPGGTYDGTRAARAVVRAVPGRPGRRRAWRGRSARPTTPSRAIASRPQCHLGDFMEYAALRREHQRHRVVGRPRAPLGRP